jgi:hypothetical protein
VVAVIELLVALANGEVPDEFVAIAVNVYSVFDCKPVTVTGDVLLALYPPGFDVTVYDDAAPPVSAAVKVTVEDPLLKARLVPTFVAEIALGASGISTIGVVY